MGTQVSWQVQLAVKPGELRNFRARTREMVASTRDEQGVVSYERYVGEDGATVRAREQYADSAATVAHLRALEARFGKRFGET